MIYLNKKNEGIVKTLNLGLKHVQSDFVFFIASDDIAIPKAISTLHHFLSQNPEYGMAVGDNILIDKSSRRCYWDTNQRILYKQTPRSFSTFGNYLQHARKDVNFTSHQFGSYESLLKGNYITNGCMIRTSLLKKIGGFSEKAPLEDLHIMLQLSKHSKLKYIPEPLLYYRWHPQNTVKNLPKMAKITYQTLMQEEAYATENGYGALFYEKINTLKNELINIETPPKHTWTLFPFFRAELFEYTDHWRFQIKFLKFDLLVIERKRK